MPLEGNSPLGHRLLHGFIPAIVIGFQSYSCLNRELAAQATAPKEWINATLTKEDNWNVGQMGTLGSSHKRQGPRQKMILRHSHRHFVFPCRTSTWREATEAEGLVGCAHTVQTVTKPNFSSFGTALSFVSKPQLHTPLYVFCRHKTCFSCTFFAAVLVSQAARSHKITSEDIVGSFKKWNSQDMYKTWNWKQSVLAFRSEASSCVKNHLLLCGGVPL